MGRTAIFKGFAGDVLFAASGEQAERMSRKPSKVRAIFRLIRMGFLSRGSIVSNYSEGQSYPLVKIICVLMLILTNFV
jgi:hypothetical protein